MRQLADEERLRRFMRRLGEEARSSARVYFTGGATALLIGWRASTVDIDLAFDDDGEALLRLLPPLKEELSLNVELASPAQFIPELTGWRERCIFICREGPVDFFHYDPYSQALAKLERGHARDLSDVCAMLDEELLVRDQLKSHFEAIVDRLYLFPSIDPPSFRRRVLEMTAEPDPGSGG